MVRPDPLDTLPDFCDLSRSDALLLQRLGESVTLVIIFPRSFWCIELGPQVFPLIPSGCTERVNKSHEKILWVT